MDGMFQSVMKGLLQAISIERGEIPVSEVDGMPAKTYRVSGCGKKDASSVKTGEAWDDD